MSLAGITSTSFFSPQSNPVQFQSNTAQSYFRQRGTDLRQLGQALQAGDLAGAQQAYNAITQLAQNAPWQNGATTGPFKIAQREQDFEAIGQALQSGDLVGAQKAFAALQQDLHPNRTSAGPAQANANTIAEIILNLNNAGSTLLPPATASNPATASPATAPTVSPNSTTSAGAGTSGNTTSATPSASPTDNTPSADSSPEIIVNLGNGGGNSVPEIILNLSQLNLSQGNSGGSAPELILNLGTAVAAQPQR